MAYRNLSMTRVFLYAGSLRIDRRSADVIQDLASCRCDRSTIAALSTTIAVAQGMGTATTNTTTTMMMTGAMDAGTAMTMTAIPIMTAIRSAAGTAFITQVSRRAWLSAIVFLPDWSAN